MFSYSKKSQPQRISPQGQNLGLLQVLKLLEKRSSVAVQQGHSFPPHQLQVPEFWSYLSAINQFLFDKVVEWEHILHCPQSLWLSLYHSRAISSALSRKAHTTIPLHGVGELNSAFRKPSNFRAKAYIELLQPGTVLVIFILLFISKIKDADRNLSICTISYTETAFIATLSR